MINIYIFGAGQYGKKFLNVLRKLGGKEIKVCAFIDNNETKYNEIIEGLACISVPEAIKRGAQSETVCIAASSRYSNEIMKQLKDLNFSRVIAVGELVHGLRYFIPEVVKETDYREVRPFNHYESPYPDIAEIHKHEETLFSENKAIQEIDFNVTRQLALAKEMENIDLPEWPDKGGADAYRYYYHNDYFMKGSADVLYYMLRILKPQNVIEVGSGFSTAVMLDTNEYYFDNKISIHSIEPHANRLKALLKPADNLKIYEHNIQEIPISFFEVLSENDILFIDSSHVSKFNSDVNYIFFEVLPRLKRGVYIHFHDIFYPFIYPKDWIYEGRSYNEMYILRAFLMNNENYTIQFFGEMLNFCYKEKLCKKLEGNCGGSIWLRKEI